MAYAGCARHKWFDALKRDKGFNLAIINPDLMKSVADEIKDFNRDEGIAVVSIYVTLSKGLFSCCMTQVFEKPNYRI